MLDDKRRQSSASSFQPHRPPACDPKKLKRLSSACPNKRAHFAEVQTPFDRQLEELQNLHSEIE
jgi:hypothetical protein